MTSWEVARKYLPLLSKGRIDAKQYAWLLANCQTPPVIVTGHPTDTTHTDEAEGRSQKERLLSVLSDHAWHDTPEILERVYGGAHLGIARIGARIADLKADGHQIESKRLDGSVWAYRLL